MIKNILTLVLCFVNLFLVDGTYITTKTEYFLHVHGHTNKHDYGINNLIKCRYREETNSSKFVNFLKSVPYN